MKVYYELDLANFKAWSGGADTLAELTHEEIEELNDYFDMNYTEMDETAVNDMLWFDRDYVAQIVGYTDWDCLENVHKYGTEVTVDIFDIVLDDDDMEVGTISAVFEYDGDDDHLNGDIEAFLEEKLQHCVEGFNYSIVEN